MVWFDDQDRRSNGKPLAFGGEVSSIHVYTHIKIFVCITLARYQEKWEFSDGLGVLME